MKSNGILGVLATAGGLLGAFLGIAQSGAEPCPTQCASGKIPLGIAAPTSGQAVASAFGTQSVKPVEIGVRELNAAGGLMGIPVELAVADDQCEPGTCHQRRQPPSRAGQDQFRHRPDLSGCRDGCCSDLCQGRRDSVLADHDRDNGRTYGVEPRQYLQHGRDRRAGSAGTRRLSCARADGQEADCCLHRCLLQQRDRRKE